MASLNATTSYACQGAQGRLTLDSVYDAPGAPSDSVYSWTVVNQATGTDYGGTVEVGESVDVPDGEYQVRVYAHYPGGSSAASTQRSYQVSCSGNSGGGPCTLAVTILGVDAPTTTGGWGQLRYRVAGATDPTVPATLVRVDTGSQVTAALPAGNGDYALGVPPAGIDTLLLLTLTESSTGCSAQATDTVPAYPEPIDPSLGQPPRWEPVGGVLPNPVLLQVEAALTDAQGAARPGLYVEVELRRHGQATAFASFRATVRTATQLVDAAPYLRAELVAAQRYAATAGAPLLDPDAGLRFTYRFRVVDRAGAGPWLTRAGQRWAVLAALPAADDTMQPFVADGAGRVASVFPDGAGVQVVGYPLEATVLLPPATGTPRYAELRYLSAAGAEVEIRAWPLPEQAAGVLRIPLPADPLPCAHAVEVSVRADNRAYAGTCTGTVTPPLTSPGSLLTERGRLLR